MILINRESLPLSEFLSNHDCLHNFQPSYSKSSCCIYSSQVSLLTILAHSPRAIKFTSYITSLQHTRSCLSAASGDPINSGDTAWFAMHSYTNKRGIEKLLHMMTSVSYNFDYQ